MLLKIGGTSRLLQQSPRRSEGVTSARVLIDECLLGLLQQSPAEARESPWSRNDITLLSSHPSTKPPQKRGSHEVFGAMRLGDVKRLQQSPRRSEGVTEYLQIVAGRAGTYLQQSPRRSEGVTGVPSHRYKGGTLAFNKAPTEARESPGSTIASTVKHLCLQQSPRRSEGVTGTPAAAGPPRPTNLQQSPRRSEGVTDAQAHQARIERLLQQSPRRSEGVTPELSAEEIIAHQPSTKPPQKRGSHQSGCSGLLQQGCALQQSPRRSEGVTNAFGCFLAAIAGAFNKAPAEARE